MLMQPRGLWSAAPTHIDIVLPAELLKLKRVVALMAINPTP